MIYIASGFYNIKKKKKTDKTTTIHTGCTDPLGIDVTLMRSSEVLVTGRHEALGIPFLNGDGFQPGEIQEFFEVFTVVSLLVGRDSLT